MSAVQTPTQTYYALDTATVVDYVRDRAELADIFRVGEALEAVEVGDGNLNLVFKVSAVSDPRRTVVVKQALPYVRLVGESWPLSPDRARIEGQALRIYNEIAPEWSPELYLYDADMYLMVVQNLNAHIVMRYGLNQGITYPRFAGHIGLFLGRTLSRTSDFVLDHRAKKEQVAAFINVELCKISEDLIFTEPYRKDPQNLYHAEIEPQVLALQADEALRAEVAQLKAAFMTSAQALLHGDLHTGSIMVNQTDTYVIDSEFAFYGPIGFDVGAVIGNLLLSYAAHEVRTADAGARAAFRRYLTGSIVELWQTFAAEFAATAWTDDYVYPDAFRRDYLLRVLQDAAGFAGAKIIRRIVGLAGVSDIRDIEDIEARSIAASLALNIGQALIHARHRVGTIDDLVQIAVSKTPSYPWKG